MRAAAGSGITPPPPGWPSSTKVVSRALGKPMKSGLVAVMPSASESMTDPTSEPSARAAIRAALVAGLTWVRSAVKIAPLGKPLSSNPVSMPSSPRVRLLKSKSSVASLGSVPAESPSSIVMVTVMRSTVLNWPGVNVYASTVGVSRLSVSGYEPPDWRPRMIKPVVGSTRNPKPLCATVLEMTAADAPSDRAPSAIPAANVDLDTLMTLPPKADLKDQLPTDGNHCALSYRNVLRTVKHQLLTKHRNSDTGRTGCNDYPTGCGIGVSRGRLQSRWTRQWSSSARG